MALTEKEQTELLRLLEMELHARCSMDFATYAGEVLGFRPAAHHLLLAEGLEQIEQKQLDVLLVMMPPGSAKSSYGSVAFPAWYLGRNPRNCVIAASHTAELAERFGRRVRNIVASPLHQAVFPECALSTDSTAAGRWDTSHGGEYFAAGVGGAVTGRRADLAIIDDPVKSREDADSETIREKQWAWWRDDLSTRLKPGAGVVLIMTRWHEDDLAGRLLEDIKESGQRVRVIKLPMEAQEGDELGRKPGESLWPDWFSPEMVQQAKREPRTWSALYQQEPRPIGGGEFQLAWLNSYERMPSAANRVLLVDPASGKTKTRGDYTSMWVIGKAADDNLYVLDGLRDRLNLTERTDKLFELVRRWKPSVVGYESYGLQADIEHIKIEQERQQYRFRMVELGGAMKKEDRVRRLIPLFQQGRIWTPRSMIRTRSTGHQYDVMEEFKAEYVAFPVAAHDDAIDNLARIEEPDIKRYLVTPQHQPAAMTSRVQPYRPHVAGVGL